MRKILIFILCFCTLFLCFVIPSFADEGVTSRAIPTDLIGYTVTIPAGFSFNTSLAESLRRFDVTCDIGGVTFTYLNLGYRWIEYPPGDTSIQNNSNYICFGSGYSLSSPSAISGRNFDNSNDIVLVFIGGDTDNPNLIQTLSDSGAVFESDSGQTFTIDAGYWTPTGTPTASNDDVLAIGIGNTLIYEMPALNGWVNAEGFTTYIDNLRFTLVSANRTGTAYHLEVGYHDGYEYVRLYTIHKASSGTFTLTVDNQFRYFYFNDSFEVDAVGNALINGFFTYGTSEPDVDPPVPDINNFLTMFLNGVVSALDVDIFGYFSILDLIKVLVGACFIVWLLKMLAGG